ncbi:glycosyltransferase family 2 protein [Hyunsoonleella sp. 2307UL5-6]|uniref:glycosyltransferase family 2 protein n=1 Tax=Hyunsoonleella sp. 2307UL5-6 TaxID=3384768 RepID=UPI0039BC7DA2
MISVVIPLYNKEHTITRTLETVLEQTYKEFEVVIINDGSTDNGISVIKDFTTDHRIRIINQSNKGVSVARNEGVRHAKYEYVAFLDGDDEWLPEYLSKMHEAIQKFPKAGLFCCAGKVRSAGIEHLRLANKYNNLITKIDFYENPNVFLHTSATIVTKTEFSKTEGFPKGMKRNQDYALFCTLALQTQTVYCGFPLSIYVGDVDGQATATPINNIREHVCSRFNMVYNTWSNSGKKNKTYLVFTKYELRHFFLGFLKSKDYDNIHFFKTNLNDDLLSEFNNWELSLYKKPIYNKIAIGYIYASKIRWRLRGYPRSS